MSRDHDSTITVDHGMHHNLGTSWTRGAAGAGSGAEVLEADRSDAVVWLAPGGTWAGGQTALIISSAAWTALGLLAWSFGSTAAPGSYTYTCGAAIDDAFLVRDSASVPYFAINPGSESLELGNTTTDPYVEILGDGDLRLGSQVRFTERTGDPAQVANTCFLYSKDATGVTHLYARSSDGTVHQLTPASGGGGTLDQAYDFGGAGAGRIITADSGAVAISYPPQTGPSYAFAVEWTNQAFTAQNHGIYVNLANVFSLNVATDVYGINLLGAANAGAGAAIGVRLSGWDQEIEIAGDKIHIGNGGGPAAAQSTLIATNLTGGSGIECIYIGDLIAGGSGSQTVAIGPEIAGAGTSSQVIIGYSAAGGGAGAVAVGWNAEATANTSTALGYNARSTHNYSVAIGRQSFTSAASQIMIGGSTSNFTDFCVGGGNASSTPSTITFRPSDGAATSDGWGLTLRAGNGGGTSGNGGTLTLAGGTVTSGTAGPVLVQTAGTTRLTAEAGGDIYVGTSAEGSGGTPSERRLRATQVTGQAATPGANLGLYTGGATGSVSRSSGALLKMYGNDGTDDGSTTTQTFAEFFRGNNAGYSLGRNTSAAATRAIEHDFETGQVVRRSPSFWSQTYDDDERVITLQGRVNTAKGAGATTLISYAMKSSSIYHVIAHVMARENGVTGDFASYTRIATFRHNGTAWNIVGAVSTPHTAENDATWDCTIDNSTNTLRVRVTPDAGPGGPDVEWVGEAMIYEWA